MKKHSFIIILSFYCCSFITPVANGQDVQINGKNFQVRSKSQINAEVEYYQLKDKTTPNAAPQTYIKTSGVFSKTVFSEKEIKVFFASGIISSLGKTAERQVTGKIKFKYIDKGVAKIFFVIKKDSVSFFEYYGNLDVLFAAPGGTQRHDCYQACLKQEQDCLEEGFDEATCLTWLCECWVLRCDVAFPPSGIPKPSKYTFAIKNLKIKI